MPIDEQKIILNLQNNLEHKPITAEDLPGVSRIGLLPDDMLHFEYDPIKVYGKRPDMIDNTKGYPTKGIRDKGLHYMSYPVTAALSLPLIAYGGEVIGASELGGTLGPLWHGIINYGSRVMPFARNLLQNGITNQFARDMLIGSTTALTADQAVRTFTPYNGIADGMLRSTFGEDIQQNPYYDYMLFGAELFNPVNLISPASIASKTNLYRQFDNFGNEIDMFGRLQPSKKAIKKYSNFQKNNPGWGYTSREPLTINDVTINRRIFPRMTNSPYIEMSGSKVNDVWRFGNSNSQTLLYNPFNKGSRLGAELYKVEFPTPIYRTGYHVTRYAGDEAPYLFPDKYIDNLGNSIKLDNYNPVRNPGDNLPINTYWLGGDEINFASARPEIGLHVGATESPGRILMSRQYGSRRTVPPVVREVTWIDYPNSTRTMPDMKRWIASSENKKLWEDIGITIDDSMLEDDLYKSFNWYYDNSTTRNIEALNKSNDLLNALRRAGITSIKYGNKYEIPWGWKHIEGNFYSLPTGRKIEWPGGESHAIITPEAWWSKNRRYTPPVPDQDEVISFDRYIRNTD